MKEIFYEYKTVEYVAMAFIQAEPSELPALRARIRHLRNAGIPQLPKVGSGKRNGFGQRQIFELLVALEAEHLTRSIKSAAAFAEMAGEAFGSLDSNSSHLIARGNTIQIVHQNAVSEAANSVNGFLVIGLKKVADQLNELLPTETAPQSVYRQRDGA